ncbi:Two-component transcriptional response regulator, LuxR family [hydrothermal vent metagenome]|uniref:Two-component transcriptional response regulator, LuxR family n=1 Tax=hydrothermal vent metagenome TaxID=652676 RepID=A0A3B0YT46_9ZZZZ
MREGIHVVLNRLEKKFQLISAANYEETLSCLDEVADIGLVLLDLNMPGEMPFTGLTRVLSAAKGIPVVVLSASEDAADMQQSIELGAKGFIPKSSNNQILVAALELVLSGGVYFPPQIFDSVPGDRTTARNQPGTVQISITRRQKEVLGLIAEGKPNKEISRILGLSDGTVRTHVNAIFKLLDVNNRTQASVRGRELGLL